MELMNLHAHTTFSDGKKSPKELVEYSILNKIKALAITDHFEYFLWKKDKVSNINLYFKVISHLKEKYSQLKLFAGLELNFIAFDSEEFPYEFNDQLDLLLIENITNFDYLEKLLELKKDLSCKIGLAHPTFSGFEDYKELIKILEKNNIFIELNTSCFVHGMPYDRPKLKKHPLVFEEQVDFFKLLKNSKVKLSIGADDHDPYFDYPKYLPRAYTFIKKLNLEKNLTSPTFFSKH